MSQMTNSGHTPQVNIDNTCPKRLFAYLCIIATYPEITNKKAVT